ncbi:S41 family peptidase [Paenibacillus methanolicus]|uniref:Carboxyl-terminal processing protease n=1 Tax=Paenibacillus methanolicus TaxID=582686 RepID=A0A5S5BXC4_9BACL|nr:S41 family peptidase [Paenibacillus methanolicus]TYP71825.1 carboxyl-terminal processing protease [Paenibacillus methanolicus]
MNRFGEEAVAQRKRTIRGILLLVAVAAVFLAGRYSMVMQHPILKADNFENLSYAYNEIINGYLEGAEGKKLIDGAVEGMVASLEDPYSVYLTGEAGKAYMESYEDHFVGIGVEVREEDGAFIIEKVIEGAPAKKAGVKDHDTIVAVDGQAAKGMASDKLLGMVRGKEGTTVKLTLLRAGAGQPIELSVKRGSVPIKTVEYDMKANGIGQITIERFADKTGDEFDKALEALTAKGMKGLLLDLRGNPGGLLDPTIQIASRFLPKGEKILQVVGKDGKHVVTHKSEEEKPLKLPISILVDGHTASSSEVLTAALKEKAGATVIGEKTYGKGIVQQFTQLNDGSVLKITKAQWRTPAGSWIHKKGIEPTTTVEPPAYTLLPSLPTGLSLQNGDYGDQVKTAEQMLKVLGYLPGEAGGVFDDAMELAVERFQRSQSLPETGIVNDKTAYRMTTLLAERYNNEDPQRKKAEEMLKAATADTVK